MDRKIVLDSNVLIALIKSDDSTHYKAKEMMIKLHNEGDIFVALNLVIQETATVISIKIGQKEAIEFCKNRNSIIDQEITLDDELETRTWNIFMKQHKKGTSFIDCANMALLEKYKLDGIFSFDKFYPKNILIV